MAKILKSANFRSVQASGVYAIPSPTEIRFVFVNHEPVEVETGDGHQAATIQEGPHFQAEIIISRELGTWIRDYLNEYLKPAEVPSK